MKEHTFHIKRENAWVTYLIGGTVKDLKKILRERHGGRIPTMYFWDKRWSFGKDGDTTDGYAFHVLGGDLGEGEIFYVWIADPFDLMFHETLHITGDILFTRGFEYEYGSEEAWTYLGNEIHKEVVKHFHKEYIDAILAYVQHEDSLERKKRETKLNDTSV